MSASAGAGSGADAGVGCGRAFVEQAPARACIEVCDESNSTRVQSVKQLLGMHALRPSVRPNKEQSLTTQHCKEERVGRALSCVWEGSLSHLQEWGGEPFPPSGMGKGAFPTWGRESQSVECERVR